MKNGNKFFAPLALAILISLVTGCGPSSGQDAEKLPNARVPLRLTAHQARSHLKREQQQFLGEGPETRTLLAAASQLANLSDADYLIVQNRWVGSAEAACNFFVITALCEANYCKSDKPFYRAAQFGSYFKETGWVEVNFPDAKSYLAQTSDLDLVAQRGALHGGSMGHIAIPIQLNASRKIVVAQGNYHQSTHEIETWDDAFAQGFHYYVNFAPGANHVSR